MSTAAAEPLASTHQPADADADAPEPESESAAIVPEPAGFSTAAAAAAAADDDDDYLMPHIDDNLTPLSIPLAPAHPLPASVHALPVRPTGRIIDFALHPSGLFADYAGAVCFVVDNLFTRAECAALVALAHNSTLPPGCWQPALVNGGGGQQIEYLDVRNSGRIMVDHAGAARRIWERVEPWVRGMGAHRVDRGTALGSAILGGVGWMRPGERREKLLAERWVAARLNERLRFLRYGAGHYFRPHCDGSYTTLLHHPLKPEQRSLLTLQLYLSASDDLVGGATSFHSCRGSRGSRAAAETVDVRPVPGRVVVFQHAKLVHDGQAVERGEKVALRTDVMFRREGDPVVTYW